MVLVMIPLVGRIVTTIPWMKERLVEMMMGRGNGVGDKRDGLDDQVLSIS